MKKRIGSLAIVFSCFSVLCFSGLVFADDTLTITTYYPSPYGTYNEMRAKRIAIGSDYIDHTQYCWSGTPGGCTHTIDAKDSLFVEGNVEVAQNSAIKVGNAYLSSGSGNSYTHLATNEWYNGSSWQPTGSGELVQLVNGNMNFYSHDAGGNHAWGNINANDFCSPTTGKCLSSVGGYTVFTTHTCHADAGSPSCVAYCDGNEFLLSGGMYAGARTGDFYGFTSRPNGLGQGGSWYCSAALNGPLDCYAYCAR